MARSAGQMDREGSFSTKIHPFSFLELEIPADNLVELGLGG